MTGAITEHLDAVQIITAAFFVFFAGLIYYLRREDKREGYPLRDVSPQGVAIEGFPPMPPAKVYTLLEGGETAMPHVEEPSLMRGMATERHFGAPLVPLGDAMLAEIGPGAYPMRKDVPLLSLGEPQVRPMRVATDWRVAEGDMDPRGMRVFDGAWREVGTVRDLWVDRGVKILRYLEVELDADRGRPVLVPIFRTDVRRKPREVRVRAMLAGHLQQAPRPKAADIITAREEDQINAYFSAAYMYGRGYRGSFASGTAAPRIPG